MKILLYNWVNHDDAERRGGGVRVYHENLIAELTREPENQVYTLSSGLSYELFSRRVHIRRRAGHGSVENYEVVNSPIAAPAHLAFYSLDTYLGDTTLRAVIEDFMKEHGPFDVVQFDNLEGLTASVLELKKQFPGTRFLYYMHNYNLVCPQVNLWFAESKNCDDYNEGKRCAVCLTRHIDMREVKIAHAVSKFLKSIGIKTGSFIFRSVYTGMAHTKRVLGVIRRNAWRMQRRLPGASRSGAILAPPQTVNNPIFTTRSIGQVYQEYRTRNISCANRCFDRVLAVSNRVKEIAVAHGIAEKQLDVVYIGSRFAEDRIPVRVLDHDFLKIAYLGYERRDKGFYHFVEALEAMPRSAARRISVLVAARLGSPGILERLQHLGVEFMNFEIVDGYDHGTLQQLIEDVDLGIVPVLWEDNLPQVAIEFAAHGVPVLSSDLGGAKELCGENPRFIYRHGDVDDFIDKVLYFLDHKKALAGYADQGMDLMNMQQHLKIMVGRHYCAPLSEAAPRPGHTEFPDHRQGNTSE